MWWLKKATSWQSLEVSHPHSAAPLYIHIASNSFHNDPGQAAQTTCWSILKSRMDMDPDWLFQSLTGSKWVIQVQLELKRKLSEEFSVKLLRDSITSLCRQMTTVMTGDTKGFWKRASLVFNHFWEMLKHLSLSCWEFEPQHNLTKVSVWARSRFDNCSKSGTNMDHSQKQMLSSWDLSQTTCQIHSNGQTNIQFSIKKKKKRKKKTQQTPSNNIQHFCCFSWHWNKAWRTTTSMLFLLPWWTTGSASEEKGFRMLLWTQWIVFDKEPFWTS